MKHPERIIPDKSAFETGVEISYLRYDSLEELLMGIAKGLKDQVEKDFETGKPKLAKLGMETAIKLRGITPTVRQMWKIAEPHMRETEK